MTQVHDEITITRADFEELKAVYEKHKDQPDAVFEWRGHQFLVSYAKYLIEYLETQFGDQ